MDDIIREKNVRLTLHGKLAQPETVAKSYSCKQCKKIKSLPYLTPAIQATEVFITSVALLFACRLRVKV